MRPRKLATRVRQQALDMVRGKIRSEIPLWFPVLTKVPPGPTIVRDPSAFATAGRLAFEPITKSHSERMKEAAAVGGSHAKGPASAAGEGSSSTNTSSSSSTSTQPQLKPASFFIRPDQKPRSVRHHHLKTKPPKPPRIVFPEDQLRRRFFRDHPHELLRPKTMRETNANAPGGGNRTDWSQLQDPRYPGTVTGEHVIQHQHYLMTKRSLTEQEAYARVLEVFYRIRAREDLELQIAQDQAYHFGAQRFASDVEMNLRLEEKQLKKSDAIITEREAIRRMQSATSEKNFQNAEEIGN